MRIDGLTLETSLIIVSPTTEIPEIPSRDSPTVSFTSRPSLAIDSERLGQRRLCAGSVRHSPLPKIWILLPGKQTEGSNDGSTMFNILFKAAREPSVVDKVSRKLSYALLCIITTSTLYDYIVQAVLNNSSLQLMI